MTLDSQKLRLGQEEVRSEFISHVFLSLGALEIMLDKEEALEVN